jgi:hypothetical protein
MKEKIYLYIKEKLRKKEILLIDIKNRYLERKKYVKDTLEKIDKFENDHREEFFNIFPDCMYEDFCSIASNQLRCEFSHCDYMDHNGVQYWKQHFCKNEEKELLIGSDNEVHITFNEFCLELNMTMKDLKYYFDDLLKSEMIFRKRIISGYAYSLDEILIYHQSRQHSE